MSNRAKMQKRCSSRAVAGLILFALAAACDSPTEPSRNRPEPRNGLEIANATAVAPQQATEVQAFLVAPNGAPGCHRAGDVDDVGFGSPDGVEWRPRHRRRRWRGHVAGDPR